VQKSEITTTALKHHLNKLFPFAAVAKLGSISRASTVANLSPSALSHLVTNLEEALGTKLFKRKSHGLELTKQGSILLDFASRLSCDLETLSLRLGDDANVPFSIRVGTHETLAAHIWPEVLSKMEGKDSNLNISLLSGRVDKLVSMLLLGELHATVTVEPKRDPRLRVSTLYSGALLFYVGQEAFKGKKSVTRKEISEVPYFTDTNAHVMQGLPIPIALRHLGMENSGRFEVSSFEAAIHLAEMNLGIAVIPDRNAYRAVREKRIRTILIKEHPKPEILEYKICLTTTASHDSASVHDRLLKCFNPQ